MRRPWGTMARRALAAHFSASRFAESVRAFEEQGPDEREATLRAALDVLNESTEVEGGIDKLRESSIRHAPGRRAVVAAHESASDEPPPPAVSPEDVTGRRARRGRPKTDPGFLRAVAAVYREALACGRPPRQAVQAWAVAELGRNEVSPRTASNWIRAARRDGLMAQAR